MTLVSHLEELRRRLLVVAGEVVLGAIVCWIFYPQILDFLLSPVLSGSSDSKSTNSYKQHERPPKERSCRVKSLVWSGLLNFNLNIYA